MDCVRSSSRYRLREMRKVSGGSTLAGLPVGVPGARGRDFRHAEGPPHADRAVGSKIIVTSFDRSHDDSSWHSLLAVSRNRGVIAVDSLLRVGCAPPEGAIARCQRT